MAYKTSNRTQMKTLPSVIDDYVNPQDPVRVYDAFIDALDFDKLGIPLTNYQGGADRYYPKDLLKLIIYGYAYGIRSSRKLERACYHNLSFIWLMGDLKPDYRTIARFRNQYKESIKQVLRQCVHMCIELDLVDGNTLFIDGSGFRANASIKHAWTKERCQESLEKIYRHIDKLLEEAQRLDQAEEEREPLVKVKAELSNRQLLKTKIEQTLKMLERKAEDPDKEQDISHNTVDPGCIKMTTRQGKHAGYNAQLVTDEKHGLIVHSEATAQTDHNQLSRQVKLASENLGRRPKNVSSDCGYYSINDLKKISPSISLIIPNRQQAHADKTGEEIQPFDKSRFCYDAGHDHYICPAGNRLKFTAYDTQNQGKAYQADGRACQNCGYFGICTTSVHGRKVNRSDQEILKEQLKTIYDSPQGQRIYALRKQKAELPFGHMKRNLSAGQFLLRGRKGADAELSILSTCFNLARMMTIVGIPSLILKLQHL